MRKVFKYPLQVVDGQTIHVPYCGEMKFTEQVLMCAEQYGTPHLWCMVDEDQPERAIRIIIHCTGHDASDTKTLKHIGSFMLLDGNFVGHVFAEKSV